MIGGISKIQFATFAFCIVFKFNQKTVSKAISYIDENFIIIYEQLPHLLQPIAWISIWEMSFVDIFTMKRDK